MDSQEIRAAFADIASGINRLGCALARLFDKNSLAEKVHETVPSQSVPTPAPLASLSPALESGEKPTILKSTDTVHRNALSAAKPPKVRDPNAPKRPMSSFLVFSKENRDRVVRENPGLGYLDITRKLSQMWEVADKRPYEEANQKLLEAYKKEMDEYKRQQEEIPSVEIQIAKDKESKPAETSDHETGEKRKESEEVFNSQVDPSEVAQTLAKKPKKAKSTKPQGDEPVSVSVPIPTLTLNPSHPAIVLPSRAEPVQDSQDMLMVSEGEAALEASKPKKEKKEKKDKKEKKEKKLLAV